MKIFLIMFFIEKIRNGGMAMNFRGPYAVVSPVQFPGILNPTIYIQNKQSPAIFPQLNSPPVNLNLKVNGLEEYYKPKPQIKLINLMNQLESNLKSMKKYEQYKNALKKYQPRKNQALTIGVNPQKQENPEELLSPKNRIYLSTIFNQGQRYLHVSKVKGLLSEIANNLEGLFKDYATTQKLIDQGMDSMQKRFQNLQNKKEQNEANTKKIDFSFLKNKIILNQISTNNNVQFYRLKLQ